jgi:hypothetical protein|tara:strand:+ start:99 stop:290 length:192 start_codon:yes stop_codon:yes gene_type:complete
MITHFINWIKGLFSKKEEPIILEEIKEEIQEVVKPQRAEHCTSHARFKKSCRPCQAAVAGLAY